MAEENKVQHSYDESDIQVLEGLCKHLSGNLSARDPETGYVVITPTQVDRDLTLL